MKQSFVVLYAFIFLSTISGCAYFQKKDEPPPLPPIEETKPPLKTKAEYFKDFPWPDLPKPGKDGNDPNTKMHTWREGDTFDSIAESEMGNPSMGPKLAQFNDLSDSSKVAPGDKIVIPNPIIGLSSQIVIKRKGDKDFGSPEAFDSELKKADEYKLRFESNVNGYLYVFREGAKGVELLYPGQVKKGKRNKKSEPLMRDSGKVTVHEPLLIPSGPKGIVFDPKRIGDRVFVFLSMKQIPELEDLKDKPKLRVEEIEDVMHRVKQGDIVSDGAVKVLRISDPSEILGFTLSLNG